MRITLEFIEQKYDELSKLIASFKALSAAFPRTINAPELADGEVYVGTFLSADGTGHHTILLPGDKDDGNWHDAMGWAKEKGGDLPNRIEQAALFAQHKDLFEDDIYWSNTTHHNNSEWAWYQGFSSGIQLSDHKSGYICRARAVRRLEI